MRRCQGHYCECDDDQNYDDAYAEGRAAGAEAAYDEARNELKRKVLAEVETRRYGADLPLPINSDMLSLDEVEQMIWRL